MVVKSRFKLIKSLHQKKYRKVHGLFFVEGFKAVSELLSSDMRLHSILVSPPNRHFFLGTEGVTVVAESELQKLSALKKTNGVLAVFHVPDADSVTFNDWILVLDSVRDPGNLGTIIRLCDWFNIKHLVCSQETVDCFNPKVLQATMGSIARVNLHYLDLETFFRQSPLPIYGSFMTGIPVKEIDFPSKGILVMGNEANGISEGLNPFFHKKVAIEQYGAKSAESLNVAIASGLLLHEIRRNSF